MAYPAVRYVQLLFHKNAHSKEQFAKAYKTYTYVISIIIVIGVILIELFLLYALFALSGSGVAGGTGGIIAYIILLPIYAALQVMLLGHFSKVIHEYSEKHDEFIKC